MAARPAAGGAPDSPAKIGLDRAGFGRLRGSAFQVRATSGALKTVVLDDVTEYQRAAGIENFSIRFTHDAEAPLTQGTYRFSHPQMGDFDLFIVPQPASAARCGYVAVFNRLV